jgi:hypothetical protein
MTANSIRKFIPQQEIRARSDDLYEVLPLQRAGKAHDRVQDGHVRGKILLKIANM